MTCRWVPHFLVEAEKQGRVDYCLTMLKKVRWRQTKMYG